MRDTSSPTTWAAFLRELTSRPGWNVARLARESGVNRSSIFRWLKGQGGANIASVRAIAEGGGVDIASAMLAAGSVLGPPSVEDDAEMRIIVESGLSPRKKEAMIAHVRARRARDLEETRALVELQGES